MRLSISSVLRALAVGALAAVSLPGVHAARAGTDLLPPVKSLFAYDAPVVAPPERNDVSCAGNAVAAMRVADVSRREAMARIAELVAAGGGAEVLNGRGFNYPTQRDPNLELLRVEREAQRLRDLGR
jgi:hypothetical protein